jgi:pimeloyl-ACP methyl ester carboxylesterase
MKLKHFGIFIILNFTIWSCNVSDTVSPIDEIATNKFLKSSKAIKQYSKSEFIAQLSNSFGNEAALLSFLVQSGIKATKISYNTTTTSGKAITASGLIVIPTDISGPLALGSLQHGTIFSDSLAPSNFHPISEAWSGNLLASTGVIVAMPDYVGYGDSASEPHPYENNKGLGQSNVDFLLAVKEYIKDEKLNWNNNLLLAGYSEGGYATMATQKLLEEKYPSEFKIKASSLGAGAYNKTATMNVFLTDVRKGQINQNRSYTWVITTYNSFHGLNRPLSDYFIEPYLSAIEQKGALVSISESFRDILRPTFISNILNGTDTKFIAAVAENDIYDWKSTTPMFLIHGSADTYVPIINSQSAVNAMKAKGANISLTTVPNGTHTSTILNYFLATIDMFDKYKN